jgi:CRISPR/Cas system endoribonuclease Cas6 (RAMP superfamily)
MYENLYSKIIVGKAYYPRCGSKQAITPFCFSNIFPRGDMKKGERKSIIISSPNEKFIFLLSDQINRIDIAIHLAGMQFHVISLRSFRVDITYPSAVTSVTPIVVRIRPNLS